MKQPSYARPVLGAMLILGLIGASATALRGKVPDPGPESKKIQVGPHVWLEIQGGQRRVFVNASVCLREGGIGLECLLCRRNTKEHESILVTDAEARAIHTALLVAGAKPGAPVKFQPKFMSASGSMIKITLQYEKKNRELVTVPAQLWIRNTKTKKDLEYDWVFAGSILYPNPDDKSKPIYAASDGAYICVANVPTAMLDLPVDSPKALENRVYSPHTERIPAIDAKVTVILEPMPEAKK